MRSLPATCLLAALFALVAGAAQAQLTQAGAPPAVPKASINCDALNQGTLICVQNATPRPITKITCGGTGGLFGSDPVDLSIAHGIIAPGETTIVDFGKARCGKHIVVFTRDGHQYPFDGFDTTHNTTLLVDNE